MIRFCTEAETKQAESRPVLLYRPRQQKEAERQVSRSHPTGKAMVTHASLRKEQQQQQQRWASTFWSPRFTNCPPSAFRSRLDLSAFHKVKQLLRDSLFLQIHHRRAVREDPGREKGWAREAKAQHLWGLAHRSAHPSRAQADCCCCFF